MREVKEMLEMKKACRICLCALMLACFSGCKSRETDVQKESAQTESAKAISTETDTEEAYLAATDSIFIADAVYMETAFELGEDYAMQLRTFAENYEQWIPAEGEMSPGVMDFAVYDLDGDGQLELLRTQVQGTILSAYNSFYQADVEKGIVYELDQQTAEEGLALEISWSQMAEEGLASAYIDEQGRIIYLASDSVKVGIEGAGCTEGYYYLENQTVVSREIRSYTKECYEQEKWSYTYYLPEQEQPVTKKVWEAAGENFLDGKLETDCTISWKSLYEEEIAEKKVQDWFLLLAESLEQAGFCL